MPTYSSSEVIVPKRRTDYHGYECVGCGETLWHDEQHRVTDCLEKLAQQLAHLGEKK
jgi:hypothetical protein